MMADASASPEEQASGRLHIAQRRLILSYPFHAHFVSQWQCYPSQRVTTMGVTLEKSGLISLLYNPDFVVACSLPELCGVLHHEVHHLLFEHPFADPDAFPDRQARLIAE